MTNRINNPNHPSFGFGSNGSGNAVTINDVRAKASERGLVCKIESDGDAVVIDGLRYDSAQEACESLDQ